MIYEACPYALSSVLYKMSWCYESLLCCGSMMVFCEASTLFNRNVSGLWGHFNVCETEPPDDKQTSLVVGGPC